jgi:voltage-gated sodium channel
MTPSPNAAFVPSENALVAACQKVTRAKWFQNFITGVIVFAAVLVGLETNEAIVSQHLHVIHALDKIVLGVFTLEIVLKMIAEAPRPWRFFKDGWNVFDFLIVVACFLPLHAEYATVLRVLRLLRVLKLVHALPRLQILVNALLKSIPSMGYVSVFLVLHFYVYGVAGVFMFGHNDPEHFGTLPVALLTLFTVVTMEGWADVMYIQMKGCAAFPDMAATCQASSEAPLLAPFFFITFILLGTMIILNLFIGVIMNGMNEAQEESENLAEEKRNPKSERPSVIHDAHELHKQIEELAKLAAKLKDRVQDERPSSGA